MDIKLTMPVLGAIAMLDTAGAAMAQDYTLTYTTYLPQSFTWAQVDDWFMDEIETQTDGRVVFERSYGGSLLSAVEVLPGLSAGAADAATGAAVYNGDLLPLASGLIQPYVTENADAAARAFSELSQSNEALAQEWQDANLVPAYSLVATENAFWTNKAIDTTDDLKGMRIRASGGVATVLQELGATPVAMGMGDGIQAFKSGAIDGFSAAPFDVSTLVGLQDIADYAGDAGRLGVYASVTMAFNLDTWNSFPEEIQSTITEIAVDAPAKYLEIVNSSVDEAVEKINAADGIEIVRTSAEVDAEWEAATRDIVWNAWADDLESRGVPAKETFAEFRDLITKYEASSTYVTGFDRITGDANQAP